MTTQSLSRWIARTNTLIGALSSHKQSWRGFQAVLIGLCLVLTGCPDLSQSEIQKYAIKRKKDEEDTLPPAANAKNNQPPQTTAATSAGSASTPPLNAPPQVATGIPPQSATPPQNTPATSSSAAPSSALATPAVPAAVEATAAGQSAPAGNLTPAGALQNTEPHAAPPSAASDLSGNSAVPAALGPAALTAPPSSPAESLRRAAEQLRRIGDALAQYRVARGSYPPHAIHSPAGEPLLSWRVLVLPYLGYQQLYDRFRLDQPWDSTHNRALLNAIPEVYQSLERPGTTTRFMVPTGPTTLFTGQTGVHPRRVEDGLEQTAVLLEVDDTAAAPWTEPRDWELIPQTPRQNLGTVREFGFLALFGSGSMRFINNTAGPVQLKGIFTIDGGEQLATSQFSMSLEGALARLAASTPANSAATSSGATVASGTSPLPPGNTAAEGGANSAAAAPSTDPIAAKWREQAELHLSTGDGSAAAAAYYSWLLLQSHAGPWTEEVRWIPALKRPTALVRAGIGIDYSGPSAREAQRLLAQANQRLVNAGPSDRASRRQVLQSALGSIGTDVADLWTRLPQCGPAWMTAMGEEASAGPPFAGAVADRGLRPLWLAPQLEFLGADSSQRLAVAADKYQLDLLLRVEVREPANGNRSLTTLRIVVVDVFGRREIYKTPAIKVGDRLRAQQDMLQDDPWPPARTELEDFLAQKLRPTSIPSGLQAPQVTKRVAQLTSRRTTVAPPLRALVELKFYHSRGLLPLPELLRANQQLTTDEAGLALMAGSSADRESALATWLPTVLSAADLEQQKQAVRRERDDD